MLEVLSLVTREHGDGVASILGPERPRDVVEEVEPEHGAAVGITFLLKCQTVDCESHFKFKSTCFD